MNGNASLDALARSGITFAAFREPGRAIKVFVQRNAELSTPRFGERCFVVAPFQPSAERVACIRPDMEFEFGAEFPDLSECSMVEGPELVAGLDRSGYRSAVEQAIARIRHGALQKVVLARTVSTKLKDVSLSALFLRACEMHPTAMVALVRAGEYGLWLGASPERLLILGGSRVEVDSLAGSLPAESAPEDPQEWGEKEQIEQEAVTLEVLDTLKRAGVGHVETSARTTKRAGGVVHLHTRIAGSMQMPDALQLARMLHPTPAVGGRPREAALSLIAQLEPRSRSLYAGFWGVQETQRAHLYVNIRCMEVAEDEALLHVGAGITVGSLPERECDEVELKARTWLDLISAQRAHR